jgi:2,3-bisphosphoglycerate-dependent phosphoglycerate mutase
MKTLVLLRHGESVWNAQDRFTGWTDVGLTPKGRTQAGQAGKLLRDAGLVFDVAFTSVLKRTIQTLWIVLEELDLMWIPVRHSWRLNERHYGSLQGLHKSETARRVGADQVRSWRRGYAVKPPAAARDDRRHTRHDPRYADVQPGDLPESESLEDTLHRLVPYWEGTIAPAIRHGARPLIVAHANSLRALVKHLDGLSDRQIVDVEIPIAAPLVYHLDDDLRPTTSRYLGSNIDVESLNPATLDTELRT